MTTMRLALLAIAATATTAHAQAFPPEASFRPLTCAFAPMFDAHGDDPGHGDERDVVGDFADAAGLRAVDNDFLYMRMRLDESPMAGGGTFRQGAWGFELDTDNSATTYELLLLLDATVPGQPIVRLLRNTTSTMMNDPSEPAEQELATFPVMTHARIGRATGDSSGNTEDHWLDLAVPWSMLGIDRDDRIRVWVASSTSNNSLNGDFACHAGGGGVPRLDAIGTDSTIGDPLLDSDGDGFTDAQEIAEGSNPNDPNSVPESRLEGGGGCSTGGGAGLLIGVLALRKRRRA